LISPNQKKSVFYVEKQDNSVQKHCQSDSVEISGNTRTHRQHGKCWKNGMAVLWRDGRVEWNVRR